VRSAFLENRSTGAEAVEKEIRQMLDPAQYSFVSEFYIIEKAVEVEVRIAGEPKRIRIEAQYRAGIGPPYSTGAYIREEIAATPAYPHPKGSAPARPAPFVWVTYNLPWTARDSADDAIAQALRFLRTECDP
jgi:hypothetical protein